MKIEQNFRFRQKKNKKIFRRIYGEEARFFQSNENKNLNVRIEWREFWGKLNEFYANFTEK